MGLLFLSLLACDALYDTDILITEVCIAEVTSLRPADGSQQVPVDARLLAVLNSANTTCSELSVAFTLFLDGEEQETGTPVSQPATGLVELVFDSPLEPDQTYDLEVEDLLTGTFFDTTFSTGTDDARVLDGVPLVTIDALTLEEDDPSGDEFLWTATLTVEHTPSSLDLSLLHLRGGESITESQGAFFATSEGLLTVDIPFSTSERTGEACFQVTQEDETGRGGDASEVVCQDLPQVPLGCSSTAVSPRTAAWLLLPMLTLVRRRC